eukprot:TRINITY_DN9332_c0_g1_i1.p1 TRINITY_DN9332_c0_g1~~TRINITY_DN9332_c0_g1_i1.p1  ORF type:complete len:155 (-),score=17.78 TRINITY_DN9332_c0_g1_i1:148-612(-)
MSTAHMPASSKVNKKALVQCVDKENLVNASQHVKKSCSTERGSTQPFGMHGGSLLKTVIQTRIDSPLRPFQSLGSLPVSPPGLAASVCVQLADNLGVNVSPEETPPKSDSVDEEDGELYGLHLNFADILTGPASHPAKPKRGRGVDNPLGRTLS